MNLLIPAVALVFAVQVSVRADNKAPHYRYTVSLNQWDDRNTKENLWSEMEVRVNGKLVGRFQEGLRKLEELPVDAGEHIRLDLPPMPRNGPSRPGHWVSSFVHRWMAKGAFVDWYEGGEKFKLHTVTWADFMNRGGYVRSMDEVIWVVDGQTIGKGDLFLKFIEPWKARKGLVIQILKPLDWAPPMFVEPGVTLSRLELLGDGENIRVYQIDPLPKDSPASAD